MDMIVRLSPEYSEAMSSMEPNLPEISTIDLDSIERDLADVEKALARLEAGTYWTDEITGQPLPDSLLEAAPLTRRNPGSAHE